MCRIITLSLIHILSEQGIKAGMLKTEEIYMEQNNKRMHEVTEPLYFVIDEKLNSVDVYKRQASCATTVVAPAERNNIATSVLIFIVSKF